MQSLSLSADSNYIDRIVSLHEHRNQAEKVLTEAGIVYATAVDVRGNLIHFEIFAHGIILYKTSKQIQSLLPDFNVVIHSNSETILAYPPKEAQEGGAITDATAEHISRPLFSNNETAA